uniref:EF-hand domain-containing protein n=1 Tax=Calcidiscus leptoporus TaxID=127549 RepID=A0A7S0J465_9EUKA|mmetsp:Transcript_37207/g.86934  ORF Transcript_37207/g.86934 Transcript_37207/m.86934 type:complete len:259 (+) Transcript_37207:51-827(+)
MRAASFCLLVVTAGPVVALHTASALRAARPTAFNARACVHAAARMPPLHARAAAPAPVAAPLVVHMRHALARAGALLPRLMAQLLGAFACAAAALLATSGNIALAAAKKSSSKAMGPGTGLLFGVTGGAAYLLYSYLEAEREDREEEAAVKKEEKRLEGLAKEFTDIEEGVVTDEELMDSLRRKLGGNSTNSAEGGGSPDAPPAASRGDGGDGGGNGDGDVDGGDAGGDGDGDDDGADAGGGRDASDANDGDDNGGDD